MENSPEQANLRKETFIPITWDKVVSRLQSIARLYSHVNHWAGPLIMSLSKLEEDLVETSLQSSGESGSAFGEIADDLRTLRTEIAVSIHKDGSQEYSYRLFEALMNKALKQASKGTDS